VSSLSASSSKKNFVFDNDSEFAVVMFVFLTKLGPDTPDAIRQRDAIF
jgi:hypothetical protein